jgi:hypothetical protein
MLMNMIYFFCLLNFRRLFVSKPRKKLSWTTEDYERGRKWAMAQPHPFKKGKTLWDLCYDRRESVNTVDNLNKFIFNEI